MTTLPFLKRRIVRGLVRDDIDQEELIGWISSATGRINQELRVRDMIAHVSIPLTKNEFTLPPGFISVAVMSSRPVGSTAHGAPIVYATPEEISGFRAIRPTPGPAAFTILGRQIVVSPFTSSNYELDLFYYRRITQLLEDDDTNFVLQNHPDLYFNAAMVFGHQYYLEYDMADKRENRVILDIGKLNENYKMEKHGDGPLIVPPAKKLGGRFS